MAYRKPDIPKPRKPRAKETKPRKVRLLKHEVEAAFLGTFEAICAMVKAGSTFAQAVALTPGAPCLATFKKMASASPDHAERMSVSLKARERGMNYRYGRANALDDDALQSILVAIQQEPTRHVHDICKELGHSYNAVASRARRDRAFRLELEKALAKRAEGRADDGVSFLASGLMRNDLWRNVCASLRLSDSDDADDIRQDAVLAMLESRELNRDALIRSHFRKVRGWGNVSSLDEEVFSDGDRVMTRSDLMPATAEMGDIYAW